MPILEDIDRRSAVFQLIYDTCSQYAEIVNQLDLNYSNVLLHRLHNIREPLWSYFRQCCQSLEAVDSNAQFSEIFQTKNFNTMNQAEENLFFWKSTYLTWCLNCNIPIQKNVSIFRNYLRLTDLQRSGLNIVQWPIKTTFFNHLKQFGFAGTQYVFKGQIILSH